MCFLRRSDAPSGSSPTSRTNVTELVEESSSESPQPRRLTASEFFALTDDRPFWLKRVTKHFDPAGDGFSSEDLELVRPKKELL